jgi:myo-inositol-1(or 4)-monophosphatase
MINSALMNVMTAAALKAGRGLKRDFGEVENLQVSVKGPGDFVTIADKKSERTIFEELSKARPGYGFILEEGGIVEGADKSHVWHIDPLDGTTNFLHGLPIFAVSIGLERDGQIVAGVVYNPANDDIFVAEKGQGAYYNNRRIRVAVRRDMAEGLIATGIPPLAGAAIHPNRCRRWGRGGCGGSVAAPDADRIRRTGPAEPGHSIQLSENIGNSQCNGVAIGGAENCNRLNLAAVGRKRCEGES